MFVKTHSFQNNRHTRTHTAPAQLPAHPHRMLPFWNLGHKSLPAALAGSPEVLLPVVEAASSSSFHALKHSSRRVLCEDVRGQANTEKKKGCTC
jgi:hypothetical protein